MVSVYFLRKENEPTPLASPHQSGMLSMHQAYLLMVTAIGEVGTGLLLLLLPSVLIALLLGVDQVSPEVNICARIAGAALLAIGVACWLGRSDKQSAAQHGLLVGVLIYDVAAAALLAYAGLGFSMVGLALWPAVVLHASLALWCILSLWRLRFPAL
jgi:hypothetical protein